MNNMQDMQNVLTGLLDCSLIAGEWGSVHCATAATSTSINHATLYQHPTSCVQSKPNQRVPIYGQDLQEEQSLQLSIVRHINRICCRFCLCVYVLRRVTYWLNKLSNVLCQRQLHPAFSGKWLKFVQNDERKTRLWNRTWKWWILQSEMESLTLILKPWLVLCYRQVGKWFTIR